MILPSLQIPELKNYFCTETGLDSFKMCLNKSHFTNFPYQIKYCYNDRGYRDIDWPKENLENIYWCIGDSFTVGLGSPFNHTWPQVLQQQTGNRVISVSMDGASNDWISRQVKTIIDEVNPKNIIIMWSYTHRREKSNELLTDMERRLWNVESQDIYTDYIHFKLCLQNICKVAKNTNLIHLTVPKFYNNANDFPIGLKKIKNFLGPVTMLDYARDYHHFDILTSNQVVSNIIPLLST
jgi:hypothetical protein